MKESRMIIDLRDYTTTSGCRDLLIERCENQLFEEQERLGATIIGMFRDAADPDRFVWLRSMPDMAERKRILTAFYTHGKMWKSQRTEVNSWIADSDNVLLVWPVSDWSASATSESMVGMYSDVGPGKVISEARNQEVCDAIHAAGGRLLVTLEIDPVENNYPRHPIRTGESGQIWFATFQVNDYRSLRMGSIGERKLLPTAKSRLR
jgi:hypothetical protein